MADNSRQEVGEAIEAAGGLVWRDGPGGRELAVVYRTRNGGDWTLPKGKLKEGESWGGAAVREVREELKCDVEVRDFAGANSYTAHGTPKVVLFWNMDLVGECRFEPSAEVQELRWLSPEDAMERLSYPGERALVGPLAATPPPDDRSGIWRGPDERLAGSLAAYRLEAESLIRLCEQRGAKTCPWSGTLRGLLAEAAEALRNGRPEIAWRCFLAAQRQEVFLLAALGPEALLPKATATLCEGSQKLRGWRKRAVEDLLACPDGPALGSGPRPLDPGKAAKAENVYEASVVLHDHYGNQAQKLRSLKGQFAWAAGAGAGALALWFILLLVAPWRAGGHLLDLEVGDPAVVLGAALLGVMGASFSGILSLSKATTEVKVPELFLSRWFGLVRPVVGAVGAVAAYALLASGLLQLGALGPGLVLAAAVAAGFSERLVVRALSGLAGDGA